MSDTVRFGTPTNCVSVGSNGLRLVGSASAWDDYMIPGQSVRVGAVAPDFDPGFAGSSGLYTLTFDGVNLAEEVNFTVQMPHRWRQGSTIYPHVHFSPTSTNGGDSAERVVRFSLEYTWANIWTPFPSSELLQLDSRPFVPATSQWGHFLCTNQTGISAEGKSLSSMLVCRLYRDPADSADTYPQDVAFLQFDIHYEVDSMGSEREFRKE